MRLKIVSLVILFILIMPIICYAIIETDNGKMYIYASSGGLELNTLRGFDIHGYVSVNEDGSKSEISSTFSDRGYHTFLNVNGKNGSMNSKMENDDWKAKAILMEYVNYDESGWQNIDGIDLRISTEFINNGEQLQIIYDLKNTTNETAKFSLATTSDVQIDDDDYATIERLEDGSGVRLWTKKGDTNKPVQFVFYGKDVPGTVAVDNIWIGGWNGSYMENMFTGNNDVNIVQDKDSAFCYSWINRTINAGETKRYTVLMEVGEINVPNTTITVEDGKKYYYKDAIVNGSLIDKDLKDIITVHYEVDGVEYTLSPISTNGQAVEFNLDLRDLNLLPVEPHNLKVWAVDSTECSSNVEERTFYITYLKEPEVTVSSEEWCKNGSFKITDTENTPEYVKNYQYRINEGEWINCEKDTDIAVNQSGILNLDVRVEGTYEGDYSNIVKKTLKIDNNPPTTTAPEGETTTCSITVDLKQVDNESGIDSSKTMYSIKKDGEWSEWQESNKFTGLIHDTEYMIKTKTSDNVGNESESEQATIKTEKMVLGDLELKLNNSTGENYVTNTWTNQNVYVNIIDNCSAKTKYKTTDDSAQKIDVTLEENTITQNGITKIKLIVSDGTNTIEGEDEYIVKIDKEIPVINSFILDNDEWSTEKKKVTAVVKDDLSGINGYQFSNLENITADSEGWKDVENTTDELTISDEILTNGIIYVYVKDCAGNVSKAYLETKIDNQGPVINFNQQDGETEIIVTDIGSGVKEVKYAWSTEDKEPTEWNNYTDKVKYTGESKNTIYLWAKAIDNVGNVTIEKLLFNELKKPSIIAKDEYIDELVKYKITSDNDNKNLIYQIKINNEEWKTISADSDYQIKSIKDGQVVISARVLDNAGRVSDVVTKTIIVKETPKDDDKNENGVNNNDSNVDNGNINNDGKNSNNDKDISVNSEKSNNIDGTSYKSTTSNSSIAPKTGDTIVKFVVILILSSFTIILIRKIKNNNKKK